MHISIATLFPALYDPFLSTSLIHRAVQAGHVAFSVENLFSLCAPKERIDSPTFGHAAGMLIRPDIVEKVVEKQEKEFGSAFKIFFSPHGKKLDQHLLKKLAHTFQEKKHIMLIPARYEGMDARVEETYADMIISIGDYVLMGGDMPAMVLIEGMMRLLPGVIGKQESVDEDSFTGPFVDHPEFTTPVVWKGLEVPDVVRSGNHALIADWQKEVASKRTVLHHFDWLRSHVTQKNDITLAARSIPAHYVILMHSQVVLEAGREGTSSVTSLDIHDIARSAKTYGLKKYFIVTPLVDQQKIVRKLLDFWQTDIGADYNPQRFDALASVELVSTLEEALSAIEELEKEKALLVATSAKKHEGVRAITYFDQELVWSLKRPVVFVFGTARGLSQSLVEQCDFILGPIKGFSDFNHLSVRSAAAIIFDRWLGINIKD